MARTRDAQASEDGPLIAAKLMPPRVRPSVAARSRLFAALDRLDSTELTLISAPAGSGKTVLVASWLARKRHVTPVWVSLDSGDDDPVRLWTYVAEALDRAWVGIARAALTTLRRPRAPVQVAIDELLNSLSKQSGEVVIVLDDLHHVRDKDALAVLTYAIERLPSTTRIIATSRTDLSIRLPRLRARGALGEITAQHLAFTVPEARDVLVTKTGIALHDADIELLVERTEGWPAGIGLAALWLAGAESPAERIRQFSGSQRHVADYLSAEVVDAVDERTRRFLLDTAVLDRFAAPLCDAVLGTDDSATRLAALEASNLFLVPLDERSTWYRYHHLFREVLRAQPGGPSPEAARELHRRASDWFRARGDVEEALTHIAATADPSALADLLAAEHLVLIRTGRMAQLMTWLHALPASELTRHPVLAAAGTLSAGLLAEPAANRARLANIAEAGMTILPEAGQRYVAAVVALTRAGLPDSDLGVALENARRAVELSRGPGSEVAVAALAIYAYALYLAEDTAAARLVADEALERPEAPQRPHGLIYAHAVHALICCDAGQARAGEAEARHAVILAQNLGLAGVWSAGVAHHALGEALLQQGRSAEAERELERAELLRRAPQPRLDHAHTLIVLARARVARGKLPLAMAELALAREQLGAFADAGRLPNLASDGEHALGAALEGSTHPIEPPSQAELAVLRLLAGSLTQREIGDQLFLTMNTVKTHTASLYRKLGVNSREAAVHQARATGLIENGESPG